MTDKPFVIRNGADGREFELPSKEAFDAVYGADPSWYIATGPHSRAFQDALAELQARQEAAQAAADAEVAPAAAEAPVV